MVFYKGPGAVIKNAYSRATRSLTMIWLIGIIKEPETPNHMHDTRLNLCRAFDRASTDGGYLFSKEF